MTLREAFQQISPTINRMWASPERTQVLLDLESLLRTPDLLAQIHVEPAEVREVLLEGNVVHLR